MNTSAAISISLILPACAVSLMGHQGGQKGRVLKISRKGIAKVKWTDGAEEQLVVDALELWDDGWTGERYDRENRMYAEQWKD
jgi:hypothetical protein